MECPKRTLSQSLITTTRLLEAILTDPNPSVYVDLHRDEIMFALEDSSEALNGMEHSNDPTRHT